MKQTNKQKSFKSIVMLILTACRWGLLKSEEITYLSILPTSDFPDFLIFFLTKLELVTGINIVARKELPSKLIRFDLQLIY